MLRSSSAGRTAGSRAARAALVDPAMLRNRTLRGGLIAFFFQYLLQAGLFFAVPLFLSVALGLSAIATGVRLLPLSITLLLAAVGCPQGLPERLPAPRRAARVPRAVRRHRHHGGRARRRRRARDRDLADAARRARHRRAGLPARQRDRLVGARRAERRGRRPAEHRHQPRRVDRHRAGRRGAHLGAHHVVPQPASRTTPPSPRTSPPRPRWSWPAASRSCPTRTSDRARQGRRAPKTADAIVDENANARIDGLRASLSVLALIALIALFSTRRIPTRQPSDSRVSESST